MKLGAVIAGYRWTNRIEQRALAKEPGISASTLCRFENGQGCDGETLARIITWLFSETSAKDRRADELPVPGRRKA